MDSKRVNKYIKSVVRDIDKLKYEETKTEDGRTKIYIGIDNYFMTRVLEPNDIYDTVVKRLFEEFFTSISMFYIRNFWRI